MRARRPGEDDMQSYYVTFYLQYQAYSEDDATARAERLLQRVRDTEQVEEAVVVAVGLSPKTEE